MIFCIKVLCKKRIPFIGNAQANTKSCRGQSIFAMFSILTKIQLEGLQEAIRQPIPVHLTTFETFLPQPKKQKSEDMVREDFHSMSKEADVRHAREKDKSKLKCSF